MHLPAAEATISELVERSRNDKPVESDLEVLLLHIADPLCEGTSHFKVLLLCRKFRQYLQVDFAGPPIVPPHHESEFELTAPEISNFSFHGVKLAYLKALMVLL